MQFGGGRPIFRADGLSHVMMMSMKNRQSRSLCRGLRPVPRCLTSRHLGRLLRTANGATRSSQAWHQRATCTRMLGRCLNACASVLNLAVNEEKTGRPCAPIAAKRDRSRDGLREYQGLRNSGRDGDGHRCARNSHEAMLFGPAFSLPNFKEVKQRLIFMIVCLFLIVCLNPGKIVDAPKWTDRTAVSLTQDYRRRRFQDVLG